MSRESSPFDHSGANFESARNGRLRNLTNMLRSLPHTARSLPNTVRSLPKTVRSLPNTVRNLPNTVRNLPKTVRNLPNTVRSLPKTARSLPKAMHRVPNSMRNVPHTVRSAMGNVPPNVLIYSFWSIVLLLAISVLINLPVLIPSSVNTFGTISSAQKWTLVKGTDGRLVASTLNYKTGLNEGYRVSNVDPGGSVSFSLRPNLSPGQSVTVGDTVGSIYSSETQERLIALSGELAAARGLLAVNASGQKAAIVSEAQQRLQFAKRKRDEHRTIMARAEQLHAANLISLNEYERARSDDNVLQDEVHIAEAGLEAARTGAKPEQLDLAQTNIAALENEIEAVKRRATTYTLTAPISGTISRAVSADTLLTISDTTELLALIPVKTSDYARVANTPEARITLRGLARQSHGKIIALDRETQVVQGQTVVIATALLAGASDDLMPGMLAKCRIFCRPVTASEYLKRVFTSWTASQDPLWSSS